MVVEDIRQGSPGECGAACLAVVLSVHGHPGALAEMQSQRLVSATGWNLLQLKEVATRFGLVGTAVTADLAELADLEKPAILHWRFNHFVVLLETGRGVTVHDPAIGRFRMSWDEAGEAFTGVAMTFRSADSTAVKARRPGRVLRMPSPSAVDWSHWSMGLLAVLLSVTGALLPAAIARIEAAASSTALVVFAASAFGMLAVARVCLTLWYQQRAEVRGYAKAVRSKDRLMSAVFRLPFHVFERREVNELAGLVDRGLSIENDVDRQRTDVVLAAMITVATLGVLAAIDWRLGIAAVIGTAGLLAISERTRSSIDDARTHVDQEMRASRNLLRENLARRRFADTPLLDRRTDLWKAGFERYQQLACHLQILVLNRRTYIDLVAAIDVIVFTATNLYLFVGGHYPLALMLIASFLNYTRVEQLRRGVAAREDGLRTRREAKGHDALLGQSAAADPERRRTALRDGALIRLEGVGYSHDQFAPILLRDVTMTIAPRMLVAIEGRSGAGKSTLAKVLLGLYQPQHGEVRYAQDLESEDVGYLSQESAVLSGSVRENVLGFGASDSDDDVWNVLDAVGLKSVIERSNMGLETLISPTGAPFSAGERQRIAIARQLFRKTKVIVLDEATAHLDEASEERAVRAMRETGAAIVYFGHSPLVRRMADRRYCLDGGLGEVAS